MVTRETVEAACAEWRQTPGHDSPQDVVMGVIDEHAKEEGLVDDEGYGKDTEIELAYTTWLPWAEDWFRRHSVTCPVCGKANCPIKESFVQATRTEPMKSLGWHGWCASCEVSFETSPPKED